MRVPIEIASESRPIYRSRLWEMATGDLMAGCGRTFLLVPMALVIGALILLVDLILSALWRPVGVELAAIAMGVGCFVGAHYRYARVEQNPFGSVVNGVYREPVRNPRILFLADGSLLSGVCYFVVVARFWDILWALPSLLRAIF